MPSDPPIPERRRYRRVRAPVLIRPVSVLAYSVPRRVIDVGAGGLRAYADDRHDPGKRLELELVLPDGSGATVLAEVVWVDALPEGSPARYDVGLRFVDGSSADLDRIRKVLDAD